MKLKLLTYTILISSSALMAKAYAACTPRANFLTTSVTMSNITITIRPNEPNGHITNATRNFVGSPRTQYDCSGNTTIRSVLTKSRPAVNTAPYAGRFVYTTNIPGLAMRLEYNNHGANGGEGAAYWPKQHVLQEYNKNLQVANGTFKIEFYKVGPITQSGSITSGLYARRHINGLPGRPLILLYINATLRILGYPTCKIQNNADKNIILNTVKRDAFKGIGTVVGEKSFNLDLLCSGSGGANAGNQTADPVSVKFDFSSGNVGSEYLPNIATATTRAQGVATQLLHSYKTTNTIVKNGSVIKLGNVGINTSNVSYQIPMKARYIQTATAVTPGKVQSRATVTIQYN